MEVWKTIKGYEGLYEVSNLGRVKSLPRELCNSIRCYYTKEKILKPGIEGGGYFYVNLSKNAIVKNTKIHKLVAVEFLNHIACGYELVIDHKNDDKTDNRVENLQIVTQRFNARKTQGKYSSKYKGVTFCNTNKNWRSVIYIKGKNITLGRFKTEEEASEAYQNKLKIL